MSIRTDIELIQRTLSGETEAFGELVLRYQDAVYAIALQRTASFADAQDVAQEVFIEAYKSLYNLVDPDKFPSWLYRITQYQCNRWLRKKVTNTPIEKLGNAEIVEISIGETPPDKALECKEISQMVLDAITALPEKVGEVVTMYYIDGMSYDEIASFLSIPKTTAKGRLQMGRKGMRKALMTMVEDTIKQNRPDEKFASKVLTAAKKSLSNFEYGISISQFHQALDALVESRIDPAKHDVWRLGIVDGLGRAYGAVGRIVESRKAYEELIRLAQETETAPNELVHFYNEAAEQSLCLGEIEEAETHALEALKIAEELGDLSRIACAHKLLGDIFMAQCRWDDAILHYQSDIDIIYTDGHYDEERARKLPRAYASQIMRSHKALGIAYMKKGDYQAAVDLLKDFDSSSPENWSKESISGVLKAHAVMDMSNDFIAFLNKYQADYINGKEQFPLTDWYLEDANISDEFTCLDFADDFTESDLQPSWAWIDEFGDCSCRFAEGEGLEIHAANGRGMAQMNLSAPRLMQEISGDFACEVSMLPVSGGKPQIGGLLVWKNMGEYIRFDRGRGGRYGVWLRACVEIEKSKGVLKVGYILLGTRILPRETGDLIHLRLERAGSNFSFYCSYDGVNWLKYDVIELEMDDPVHIGIYAIGTIDRTIYCGEHKEGTATLFRNFRLWRK